MSLTLYAAGIPAPQGSKRAFVIAGKARLVEMSKRVKPWRRAVELAAIQAARIAQVGPFVGPVSVRLEFVMPRPKKTKHPACTSKPDLDKLVRATLDGLAPVIPEDSCVVRISASKRFARESGIENPGCLIEIRDDANQGVEIGPRVATSPWRQGAQE